MSRQSYSTRNILGLRVETTYSDDYGPVRRSRNLIWEFFQFEGTVYLGKMRPWYSRYRFTFRYWGKFDPEDSEGMYYQFKERANE